MVGGRADAIGWMLALCGCVEIRGGADSPMGQPAD